VVFHPKLAVLGDLNFVSPRWVVLEKFLDPVMFDAAGSCSRRPHACSRKEDGVEDHQARRPNEELVAMMAYT
jgi:hypothetical protein